MTDQNSGTLTLHEFCLAEKVSRSKIYDMWAAGTGPDYFFVGNRRRISQAARERWRAEREAAAKHAPRNNPHARNQAARQARQAAANSRGTTA